MEPAPRLTETQEDQLTVGQHVYQIYQTFSSMPHDDQIANLEIRRDEHMEYLTKGLRKLGPSFAVLDANRPWLCYWIMHSISILGDSVDNELESNAIEFLNRCQDPNGGYGGGPGQMPHLATTYAAVNSLITLGGDRSLSSINRGNLFTFLLRMKEANGGFRMHDGGEVDVRACYTAISVASVLNILDDELIRDVANYIVSCQTYEGGIAGEPGSEAHGGYTFCGLATMVLINEVNRLDLPSLINWVVFRQGQEGGFQGRTNKLVDGCYSFWQGGVAAIIQRLHLIVGEQLGISNDEESDYSSGSGYSSPSSDISEGEQHDQMTCSHPEETNHVNQQGDANTCYPASLTDIGYNFVRRQISMEPIFNSTHLQYYILLCSQVKGGFRDKPGKGRDHYHTCYCLSGLSVCQYSCTKDAESPPLTKDVIGNYSNLLAQVHPLYNIVLDRYYEARQFFCPS